jgi:hypothetical protein
MRVACQQAAHGDFGALYRPHWVGCIGVTCIGCDGLERAAQL